MPQHESTKELCERMSAFFCEKIESIYEGLQSLREDLSPSDIEAGCPTPGIMTDFSPVTEKDIEKIIKGCAAKSCCLDPIPSQIVKQCLDILLPIITRIVNTSLSSSTFPTALKIAAVTPILKKANLIPDILKNFRPVSNLPFLSKVLEKVAAKQLIAHKDAHNLREIMQSAYRTYHSTETALLYIHSDLLSALDRKQCVAMVMIDLSAAFDTVNHNILLHRLSERYGFQGNAHKWITSYLSQRKQFITINGERSQEKFKSCDVPQGSVLGPNLYEDYFAVPVGEILRKHNLLFHIYADDTQIYLPFLPGEESAAIHRLEKCLTEVRQWMATNWLQLNDSKTEFIIFGSKQNLSMLQEISLTIGESKIFPSDCVRNIGAHLDKELSLDKHLTSICKSAWYHLYQISKIRRYLTTDQTKSVIHAYVTSRLDQNNSLLLGLPKKSLKCLQCIQNASAKLIVRGRKHDHVTPILKNLHWLPIEQRILFKLLLLTFKSLNDQGPAYLKDLLVHYKPSRTLRSSSSMMLCCHRTHYVDTSRRAFYARAPAEWNRLPISLKNSDSIASFKSKLKTFLFKVAFD